MDKRKKTKRIRNHSVLEQIGKNLRMLRCHAGYSVAEIGKVLDVSYQQIQKYEAGGNRLSLDKVYVLKNFYNVSYDDFFKGLEKPSSSGKSFPANDAITQNIFSALRNVKSQKTREKIHKIIKILAA